MKWTRDEIIRHILRLESAGRPLSLGGENGVESSLYQAGSRIFGSWRNAVMAAGISPGRAVTNDRWPPSRILALIRTLARRRRPPRQAEIKQRYNYLVQAAHRTFGSWPKAMIAAGVDPLKFRQVAPWTRERIIEAVLTRALKNEPLSSGSVRPKSLVEAGVRTFGNWGLAVAAAGLDPKRYLSNWTGACSVPASEHATKPQMVGSAMIVNDPQMPSKSNRAWTHEELIQAILVRLRDHKRMNAVAVRNEDRSLYWATKKRYGCWRSALLAAGLNPEEYRSRGARRSGGK